MAVYLTRTPFGSSFKFNEIQMKCLIFLPKKPLSWSILITWKEINPEYAVKYAYVSTNLHCLLRKGNITKGDTFNF